MEPKKGIDHEEVGTEVSKREDERRDITNNPPDLPAEHRGDLAEGSEDERDAERRDERKSRDRAGAREDDGTESTG